MLNLLLCSSRTYFIGALLIAVPVVASLSVPSQEFWEYMTDYGDDNGDVLDPLEYDQILSMKDSDDDLQIKDVVSAKEKSSSDNSSAGAKGARL